MRDGDVIIPCVTPETVSHLFFEIWKELVELYPLHDHVEHVPEVVAVHVRHTFTDAELPEAQLRVWVADVLAVLPPTHAPSGAQCPEMEESFLPAANEDASTEQLLFLHCAAVHQLCELLLTRVSKHLHYGSRTPQLLGLWRAEVDAYMLGQA